MAAPAVWRLETGGVLNQGGRSRYCEVVPAVLAEDDEGCTLDEVRIKRVEAPCGETSRG